MPVPDKWFASLIREAGVDEQDETVLRAVLANYDQTNPENLIAFIALMRRLRGDTGRDYRELLLRTPMAIGGWNAETLARTDDPGEGLEDALRIRFTVADDLEPAWTVIKNDDDEGVPFRANDRARVAVSLIGAVSDRHLTWSRGSILSKLTETENITSSLAGAARAAKAALEDRRADDLTGFDEVAGTAETNARALGVNVAVSYKAHLDTDAINVRMAGLALHDGDMPLRQLGLGSKRMLTRRSAMTQGLSLSRGTADNTARASGPRSRRANCCFASR